MKTVEEQLAFINRYSHKLAKSDIERAFHVALAGAIEEDSGIVTGIGEDYIFFDHLWIRLPLNHQVSEVRENLEKHLGKYNLTLEEARQYCMGHRFLRDVYDDNEGNFCAINWSLGHAIYIMHYCLTGTLENSWLKCQDWMNESYFNADSTRYTINYHGISLSVKPGKLETGFQNDQQRDRFINILRVKREVNRMRIHSRLNPL